MKDELLGLVWGYEERVSKLTGEVLRVPVKPDTSMLTTAEFSELMEHTVMQAAQTGYVMLLPEEFKQARQKGTGARALRSLIEKLMLDVMYDIPSHEDIAGVTITRAVVQGEAKPVVRRKPDAAAA